MKISKETYGMYIEPVIDCVIAAFAIFQIFSTGDVGGFVGSWMVCSVLFTLLSIFFLFPAGKEVLKDIVKQSNMEYKNSVWLDYIRSFTSLLYLSATILLHLYWLSIVVIIATVCHTKFLKLFKEYAETRD